MLEECRQDPEEKLKEVEKEIADLRKKGVEQGLLLGQDLTCLDPGHSIINCRRIYQPSRVCLPDK